MENVFFAQLSENKTKDVSGLNNEYRLLLNRLIRPDFMDLSKKKIIEFDGWYWHGKVGRGNKERDNERDRAILDSGYDVFHVAEMDFRINPDEVLNKCMSFLT